MEYDVVVVGAGPAGLATAIRLKQVDAALSVVVLESGGRERDVQTDAEGAFKVDDLVAGAYSAAAWLHDANFRQHKHRALGTFRADAGDIELRPTD